MANSAADARASEQESYEFAPYQFDCFSFSSNADKPRFIKKGL